MHPIAILLFSAMVRLMQGSLFQYVQTPSLSLVAFESPTLPSVTLSPNKCILIGGLSDGLMPTPYTEQLEQACNEVGWSLVQPIISSSYLGFGNGSLSRDTEQLSALIKYLKNHRSAENIAIVGHSTGCQNAVHFMKDGDEDSIKMTKCIVLQAPVSDRESAGLWDGDSDKLKRDICHARCLKSEGCEREMMPREAHWSPITAERFSSLYDVNGDDDFFSSDLTDEELVERLGHIGLHGKNGLYVLATMSGKDEYVPNYVDKKLLLQRLCRAMNSHCTEGTRQVATPLMIDTGNHNLGKCDGDVDKFIVEVVNQLKMAV